MANKLKDTDYLFISAYLRARERNLLTAARMERMIEAPDAAQAAKMLQEIGYGEFSPSSESELSAALAKEREKLFADIYRFAPDHSVVDVFKIKYDYHNTKAMIKALAMDIEGATTLGTGLTAEFGESPEGIWVAEHCHEYGFIIRYPEGKRDITGYIYEPWHIRYIGKEAAGKVTELGVTFEEYILIVRGDRVRQLKEGGE